MARVSLTLFGLLLVLLPAIAGADALREIRKSGEIKVGYREDIAPFSSIGEDGKPRGYSIDICNFIVSKVGEHLGRTDLSTEFVRVTAASRLSAVLKGDIHIECGNTTSTLSRQEIVDFSNLFYVTGASLLSSGDLDINGILDLEGRSVAVVNNTTTLQILRDQLQEAKVNAKLEVVSDHHLALRMLQRKEVEIVAADRATLLGAIQGNEALKSSELAPFMLSFEPYAFPVPRDDADFRLVVNRALSELYLSGQVKVLWEKWFGQFETGPSRLLLDVYRLNSLSD